MQSQIALMNPGGIRNDLDAGDITWGDIWYSTIRKSIKK